MTTATSITPTSIISPSLLEGLSIRCDYDHPLGPLTWYGVGGPARILAHPASVQQLTALVARCREAEVKPYILGSGANLLVADEGVSGVVIKLDDPSFAQCKIKKNQVVVGAGYDLPKLVLETARAGLSGLECLAGIPGSVGGAVRMNAGGAFGDIGQSVQRVMVTDACGHVYYRDREDLIFAYRKTNIVAPYILEVQLELSPDDPAQLMKRVKAIFMYKKNSQPLANHSAGCAFKNPHVGIHPYVADDASESATSLEEATRSIPPQRPTISIVKPGKQVASSSRELSDFEDHSGTPPPAGKLIDLAGLKGTRIGGAEVSVHHANFLVAHPGCTARDIQILLDHVHDTVLERTGIDLEREIVVWP